MSRPMATLRRTRRRMYRPDDRPFLDAKIKRYLRSLRRQALGEGYDPRFPDTQRTERLPARYRALRRRRAKNRVAKMSRRANR